MSLASSEMTGSDGNATGLSTILFKSVNLRANGFLLDRNLLFVYLNGILVPERRISGQELVYQYTQRPPIDRRSVTCVLDHFWSKIFWGAAQCIGFDRVVVLMA